MANWVWPLLGLLTVLALLVLGIRTTRYKHQVMVLLALGEVHRMDGEPAHARTYYEAASRGNLRVPEAAECLHALEHGSVEPVIDHPVVDDVRRRMQDEPEQLRAWLLRRGLPPVGPDSK